MTVNPIDRLELEYDLQAQSRTGGLGTAIRARHRLLDELQEG